MTAAGLYGDVNISPQMGVHRLFHELNHGISHILYGVKLFAQHENAEIILYVGHAEGS